MRYDKLVVDGMIRKEILFSVAEAAAEKAPEWEKAIARAVDFLVKSKSLWVGGNWTVVVPSQDRDILYSANGVCQCEAYAWDKPCWHRAVSRLFRRYVEAMGSEADRLMHLHEKAVNGEWKNEPEISQEWEQVEMFILKVKEMMG